MCELEREVNFRMTERSETKSRLRVRFRFYAVIIVTVDLQNASTK